MTCREFKHIAASFSLRELTQQQDAPMFDHVENCTACEAWMSKQRSLNASLHTLRTRTAGLEAGPNVEGALLRVFRQGTPVAKVATAPAKLAVVAGTRNRTGVTERNSHAASPSTPFALRLSRFFEVGAYAAVAAALIIAVLLGVHLLRQGRTGAPIQSKTAPGSAPVLRQPTIGESSPAGQIAPVTTARITRGTGMRRAVSSRSVERPTTAASSGNGVAADEAQNETGDGYLALMFCDPLSCASETQVVRMELPAADGAQPQMADVVVGYDGVVRAVRFVN